MKRGATVDDHLRARRGSRRCRGDPDLPKAARRGAPSAPRRCRSVRVRAAAAHRHLRGGSCAQCRPFTAPFEPQATLVGRISVAQLQSAAQSMVNRISSTYHTPIVFAIDTSFMAATYIYYTGASCGCAPIASRPSGCPEAIASSSPSMTAHRTRKVKRAGGNARLSSNTVNQEEERPPSGYCLTWRAARRRDGQLGRYPSSNSGVSSAALGAPHRVPRCVDRLPLGRRAVHPGRSGRRSRSRRDAIA
jgi:hypothetical protein